VPSSNFRALIRRHSFSLLFGSIFGGVGGILFAVFFTLWITGTSDTHGRPMPFWVPLFCLLFVAIGAVSLGFFVRGMRRDGRILREGVEAQAEILEVSEDWSQKLNGRPRLKIAYRFKDGTGWEVRAEDGTFDRSWLNAAGRIVRVMYLPESPERCLIVDLMI
jgi:hypothetical protein